MANTRDLTNKIHSLGNMQKVMRAMNMIATIKLRKLISVQESLKEFDLNLRGYAQRMAQVLEQDSHPCFMGYRQQTRALVIIFTADKGLCGAHNNTVQKGLDVLVAHNQLQGLTTEVACVGNRGANYARRKGQEVIYQTEINERVLDEAALDLLAERLLQRFLDNQVQKVFVIHNVFISTIQQQLSCTQLLPFSNSGDLLASMAADNARGKVVPAAEAGLAAPMAGLFKAVESLDRPLTSAILEPGPEDYPLAASRLFVRYKLQAALINSLLSEQAARMTAMENASNNSNELKNHYVTLRNRARQGSITNELIEIISGKEALKLKKR